MLEEFHYYFRESPGLLMGMAALGAAIVVVVFTLVARALGWRIGGRLEIPLLNRIGQRLGIWISGNSATIAFGIGVLCLAGAAALAVTPVRLLMHGESAAGTVTTVVRSTYRDQQTGKDHVRSTATIRFEAGQRSVEIQRSTSQESGSWCVAGCYRKGEQLRILYFADDLEDARVDSFAGLFGMALFPGMAAIIAFLIWWLLRSERAADRPATSLL